MVTKLQKNLTNKHCIFLWKLTNKLSLRKNMHLKTKHILWVTIILSLLYSCKSESKNQANSFKVSLQTNSNIVQTNSICNFTISSKEEEMPDSVFANLKEENISLNPQNNIYSIPLKNCKLGKTSIPIKIYKDGREEKHSLHITVASDVVPQNKTFKVVKSYPHDTQAYTQGLEIKNGVLYEGTGQYGSSSLRRVDLSSGKILDSIRLANNYFGEGITLFGDSIFQLTWKARKGFIYDKQFNKISEFSYETEGWGITHNNKHLIVSDGTEYLYFYEPSSFTLVKQIPVYNNLGTVKRINELEYINGYIYANIYTTDLIIKIDPNSGKVLENIDMRNILSPSFYHNEIDVLNGIAYNAEEDRIFVTGKNWPRLFEVKFIDKISQ